MEDIRIVLASGSPRRIEMMRQNGIEPEIIKPDVDETVSSALSPRQTVMYLALKKALWVERQVLPGKDTWLIAADTVVCCDRIMGKPRDEAEAWDMLRRLRNRWHHVITGVAMIRQGTVQRKVFAETTKVYFRDYSDRQIADYIASGEVWDKAGAYAIQGGFHGQVDHIEGDYDNVVGFPWKRIVKEWKELSQGTIDLTSR